VSKAKNKKATKRTKDPAWFTRLVDVSIELTKFLESKELTGPESLVVLAFTLGSSLNLVPTPLYENLVQSLENFSQDGIEYLAQKHQVIQ
jgi:hypothetical protein